MNWRTTLLRGLKKNGWTTNNNYCVRVTANDGVAGENDLKTFADNEKTIPTILTTSRKLSTGVDARNVRNIVLMRPCNNMIEFKQIIGRGTRMYEGKDYFTIYDFVKAYHNFSDPEWDGEPVENIGDCKGPQPPKSLQNNVKVFIQSLEEDPRIEGEKKTVEKMEVRLSDGRTRQIKHISSVMYWFGDKPITAKEFVERMFSDLPRFFENEDQLREIWSNPTTREKLLLSLTEAGYDEEKLEGMKELIDAKDSDVYDVLRYVAYASETISRHQRVAAALPNIEAAYSDDNQQQFIDFILEKYVEDGVMELSPSKMRSLIELKYNTIGDAVNLFGSPAVIRETFIGFQEYLYKNC